MKTKEDKSPLLAPSTCSADSDPRQLWLVYQWINDDEQPLFQGVFDSEDNAINACRTELYCVCPATLNESLPNELTTWEGAWYPRLESKPDNQGKRTRITDEPLFRAGQMEMATRLWEVCTGEWETKEAFITRMKSIISEPNVKMSCDPLWAACGAGMFVI